MTELEKKRLWEDIDRAIDTGVRFLEEHQLHNGEFMTYISADEKMIEWAAPESTTYITAIIGHCLIHLQQRPDVDHMLSKSTAFLKYQAMRSGVWNYFTRYHWMFQLTPPDSDDTAIISALLKLRNEPFVNNENLLLQNRSGKGLFYTWFTLHPTFYTYSKSFWRLIARELKQPLKNLVFWLRDDVNRGDTDPVVNANVIAYLGHTKGTEKAINFIADLILNKVENDSDNWYKNPFVFYYFIAKLVPLHIAPIVALKSVIEQRILEEIKKDNEFFSCDMQMALAASSLIMLGSKNELTQNIIHKVISLQATTGSWKRQAFFTLPTKKFFWGCEELTTALCIEALHLYKTAASG
jgi:hypothetical protein